MRVSFTTIQMGTKCIIFYGVGLMLASALVFFFFYINDGIMEEAVASDPTGTISSPNYPSYYGEYLDLQWHINTGNKFHVLLVFTDFNISPEDSITVHDGPLITSSVILRLSGSHSAPLPIASSGPHVTLRFVTQSYCGLSGWSLSYYSSEIVTSACKGTRPTVLKATNGTIASPSYPSRYGTGLDCQILIQLAPEKRVDIRFVNFDTREGLDYIEVFDGSTLNSSSLLRVSGSSLLTDAMRTTGSLCLIRFTSSSTGIISSQVGWLITYSEV